jgi:site-specific DNA recombinase
MTRTKKALTQATTVIRIAIYVRISKDDTASMLGVERQEAQCRELIAQRYADQDVVIELYSDNNKSAWSGARRPAYEQLMADLQAGRVDLVVCYATDRLYRLVRLLEDIITASEVNGIIVPIIGVRSGDVDLSTADGRMVARQLATMAQHSSDKTSERIKDTNTQYAAKGWAPAGPAPYGYKRKPNGGPKSGHTYVKVPAEAKVVREVVASLERGDTMVAIARALNYRGVPKRSDGQWQPDDIRRMVMSPAIAGLRAHTPRQKGKKGKVWSQCVVGKGNWKAIVPRHRWENIETVLADESRKQRSPSTSYWLSGVLRTKDGRPMVGSRTRGSDGNNRRVYRALRLGDLPFVSIDADEVEGAVGRLMRLVGTDVTGTDTPEPTEAELASLDELDEIDTLVADVGRRSMLGTNDVEYLPPAEAQGMQQGLRERRAKVEALAPAVVAPTAFGSDETLTEVWFGLTADGKRDAVLGVLGYLTCQTVGRAKVSVAERLDAEKGLPVPD